MRVLLDTNVIIAAFIARGTCHELFEHVVRRHRLVTSRYILDELEEKLISKFYFDKSEARAVDKLVCERAELVSPAKVKLSKKIDPDDLPILGTAVAGACHCLVTGDRELLKIGFVEDIPILSPARFWKFEHRTS